MSAVNPGRILLVPGRRRRRNAARRPGRPHSRSACGSRRWCRRWPRWSARARRSGRRSRRRSGSRSRPPARPRGEWSTEPRTRPVTRGTWAGGAGAWARPGPAIAASRSAAGAPERMELTGPNPVGRTAPARRPASRWCQHRRPRHGSISASCSCSGVTGGCMPQTSGNARVGRVFPHRQRAQGRRGAGAQGRRGAGDGNGCRARPGAQGGALIIPRSASDKGPATAAIDAGSAGPSLRSG